jgi:hypothetical protein
MKRFLVPPVLVAALAILTGVSSPASPTASTERARDYHRNRGLILKMVNGALLLAKEDDPFDRARRCQDIAERLAEELEQAADDGDSLRAGELAIHYQHLLEGGVAANLAVARKRTPMGSTDERKLEEIRGRTAEFSQRLERRLAERDNRSLRGALRDVGQGRIKVDNALKLPPKD